MASVTFTAPPNHRTSQSCATCVQWDGGNDNCRKFPHTVRWNGGYEEIYEDEWFGMLCDAWEANPTEAP